MYLVTEMNPNIPVYTIKPEMRSKLAKKVHRNNIINCNFLLPTVTNNSGFHHRTSQKSRKECNNERWHNPYEDEDEEELILIRSTGVWEDDVDKTV